jgi:DNA (cytosine-5)-methyltransferase 1
MDRPWLLDLFAGAGGCGEGYRRAGFHVVSVDIAPQRHNPHEFYQDDALAVLDTLLTPGGTWNGYRLHDFQVIHASPPCQADSIATIYLRNRGKVYPRLIEPVRERLQRTGLPYVIENVPRAPIINPIILCGTMFGLGVVRHRLFESPDLARSVVFSPASCRHDRVFVCVVGHGTPSWVRAKLGRCQSIAEMREAMGIDWMNREELSQAIPPAYTQWLGQQLLAVVDAHRVA